VKPPHYHQWRPSLIVWALFLFCLSLPLAQSQSHIEIRGLPFQESFQCTSSNPRFYRVDLSNMPKDLDLLISVLPEGSNDAPKLFVSNNNQFPQKRNDADYSSVSTSKNIISINGEDLKEASTSLYLGLVCGDADSAKISVEWIKEIKVIANEEKIIQSLNPNGVSSQVVRLKIPKEDDIDRIVIHTDAFSSSIDEFLSTLEYADFDPRKRSFLLEVFINEGTSIPKADDVDNTVRGGSWFEWNTMIISKDSEIFCTDCMYTLSLKFSENTFLSFHAQTYKKTTKIDGTTTLDGVQKGMLNLYSFTVREAYKEEDFVLSVGVQQGKVRVYVDCDTQPKSSSSYAWDYLVESSEEIVLTKQQRSKCSTENYFFLVSGEESSIYSLRAMPQKSNHLSLGKNSPVNGEILPEEKITYEIYLPLIATDEFTIDLHSKKSLDFSLINCRSSNDCPGLIPPDRQSQISKYYGYDHQYIDKFTYNSEKVDDGLHVKINPRESGCYPLLHQTQTEAKEPLLVCAYLVTLVNQQSSSVEYSLVAEPKGHNLLQIGTSVFGSVTKDNSVFYALDLLPYENIQSVQIQFTKISGDFKVFFSKWEKYPNQESHDDLQFFHEGLIITLGDFSRVVTPYYIGVYGLEASSFSVSTVIQLTAYAGSMDSLVLNEDSAWTLNPGKPQKGVLARQGQFVQQSFDRRRQYYKFFFAQDNDWEGTLRITVNSLTGRVFLVVNSNGEFPTEEKNMWNTKHHELEISSNDPNFKKQGLYYVGVLDDDSNSLNNIIYHISYNLLPNLTPTFLSLNDPFYGTIKKGELDYFEVALLVEEFPLTIYKQSKSGNIDLYLSIGFQNKYPSEGSFTKTTKNQHNDYITLTSEDFKRFCDAQICSAYIAIMPTEDQQETDYSLLVRPDSSFQPIALEDGHQIQSIVPVNNQPAFFYFHAVPSQDSIITVNCSEREVVIYAKRIKGQIQTLDMKSLDAQTAEFTSSDDSGLTVPPLADSDMTAIAVSIHFGKYKTQNAKELTLFSILATSQILPLSTGTPYVGDALKDHYMYFIIKVMRPNCALLISLTNLEGDVDLVISYGEHTRPTLSDHQFSLITLRKTEVIEIDEDDLSVDSMAGSWVIGIYGRTAASFSLTVVYEEEKMVELQPEIPVKMSLDESSGTYFTFLHESESILKINLTTISGSLNLYVTSIDLDQDLAMNLPDQNHHKWQVFDAKDQSTITIPTRDKQACDSCIYLINIEAIADSKFSLVVQVDKFTPLQGDSKSNGILKAQKSVFFVIQTPKTTQEVQLTIGIEGSGLDFLVSNNPTINQTTYIWKETLTSQNTDKTISLKKPAENPKAIWDGKSQVNSERDSFYILLYNPTKEDLNYTLNVVMKSSKTIIPERVEQIYKLQPHEKNSFVFDTSIDYDDEHDMFLDVIFYANLKEAHDVQKSMKFNFREGQILTAQYQGKKPTTKSGQEISFKAELAPKVRSNASHAVVEQRFSTRGEMGKYTFDITNPFEFPVRLRFYFMNSGGEASFIERSEHTMQDGDSKVYHTYVNTRGKWYLWVYSCDTTLSLKVDNGDFETGMITVPKGEGYLYHETVRKGVIAEEIRRFGGTQRSILVSSSQNDSNKTNKLILSSFEVNEQKFRDYKIKKNNLEMNVSSKYKETRSQVTVEFQPIKVQGLRSYDYLEYEIRLCPNTSQPSGEPNFCENNEMCQSLFLVRRSTDQSKLLTVDFDDINQGKYFVLIQASVKYFKKFIRSFQPYVVGHVNVNAYVKDPPLINTFMIVVGVLVLVLSIALCAKGYMKLKKNQQNKEVELQNTENNRFGYNSLDFDGEIQANIEDLQKNTGSRVDYLPLDDDGDNQVDRQDPAKSEQTKQIESSE